MDITLITTKPSASVAARARKTVAAYREAFRAAKRKGGGKTDWDRTEAIVAACITVMETGKSVEVTEEFMKSPRWGLGPAYHLAHRALDTELMAQYWPYVKPVAIVNSKDEGKGKVTGTSHTMAKVARLFYSPPEE